MAQEEMLERGRVLRHQYAVRFWKTMLGIMLALAWAPLTAHCQLESATGLQFLQCDREGRVPAQGGSHCDDSSCCDWESGQCRLPQNQVSFFVADSVVLALEPLSAWALEPSPAGEPGMVTAAPAEVYRAWQFSLRAALPPRAPSVAS